MDQIISFVLMLVEGLITVIAMIPTALSTLASLFSVMPAFLSGVCVAAVGLLVTFTILGRGK